MADALQSAWSDVSSQDPVRIARALDAFRGLLPEALMTEGEGGDAHRSALRGLAYGLDELGHADEARELYRTLAEVCESALSDQGHLDKHREQLLDDRLYARAAEQMVGQGAATSAVVAALDALIAEGERTLGGAHGRVLWLLDRRAQLLSRMNPAEGLHAYDLLIARAAAADERGENHLTALAAKATELSRIDEDEQSALLWGQVLDGRRALLGFDAPSTLDAWWWRARTRYWSGDAAGADADLALLIPALQRQRGEDDALTLDAMKFRTTTLRVLARDGASTEDPLPLVRRIAVLETARFGPGADQVLASRMMAVEVQLDREDREGAWPGLIAEARGIVDDTADHAPRAVLALRSRDLLARVLRDARAEIPSPELSESGLAAAAARCAHLDRACEGLTSVDPATAEGPTPDPDPSLASPEHLANEIAHAWTDLSRWHAPHSPEALDALRAGADRLRDFGPPGRRSEIDVRDDLGSSLRDAGRGSEALAEFERSLALELGLAAEASTPEDRRTAATRLAQSRYALGATLRGIGRNAEGEAVLTDAIEIAQHDGASPRIISELRDARALALQDLGRSDEAVAEMRALYDASGDIGHAIDLAAVYLRSDRAAEAEALLRPVLAQLEAEGSAETAQGSRVIGNLALAACQLGRDAEAAATYDRLYELQSRILGPEHRDSLITLHNRAQEERHLGRYAEAARRFESVLARRTAALGADDPHTLSTLSALAGTVADAGDLPRARELTERVVAETRAVLGDTDPQTLHRIRELDGILARLGDAQQDRDALADQVRAGFASAEGASDEGATSPGLAALRYADHLVRQNRYGDALVEYSRARDALSDTAGIDWLRAERGAAECSKRLGAYREAADAYARIEPQIERLLPGDRWALADTLNDHGLVLSHLGLVDAMIPVQQRAIQVADGAGSDPERAVQLRIWLGRRLAEARRFPEALAAYDDAAEVGARTIGAEHAITLDATDDRAETLIALGRHREALKIYRTNIPAMERVLGADSAGVRRARTKQKASSQQASKARSAIIGGAIVAAILVYVIWTRMS
ncbi:MAG: tetratricopeptide repeat protein [Microbacterium sp.]|jgi:tetratricopeptide (TPR) repeat protein|uniref:tetratricopeptide repeat protein n=1 Tax=Microbacterium sp. TaxID=51671 RepID=UPI00281D8FCB|nr:tetratricopeptide repeat protein [Microbacterium sp.]MDR2321883.1 tetratricopeptide repeat protein [Microbacterium sp.]